MEEKYTLTDVLYELRDNIFRNIHVANIGIIKEIIKGDKIDRYRVEVVPLVKGESSIINECYAINGININKNDLVLIIYTDRINTLSISQYLDGASISRISTLSNLHNYVNAIIIGKINKKEINNEQL